MRYATFSLLALAGVVIGDATQTLGTSMVTIPASNSIPGPTFAPAVSNYLATIVQANSQLGNELVEAGAMISQADAGQLISAEWAGISTISETSDMPLLSSVIEVVASLQSLPLPGLASATATPTGSASGSAATKSPAATGSAGGSASAGSGTAASSHVSSAGGARQTGLAMGAVAGIVAGLAVAL